MCVIVSKGGSVQNSEKLLFLFLCRFRRGYCRHNPRKMVRLWAEKELRNLIRMYNADLPVPKPQLLKSHVLLMDFIGKNGWPAPKLKVRSRYLFFPFFFF